MPLLLFFSSQASGAHSTHSAGWKMIQRGSDAVCDVVGLFFFVCLFFLQFCCVCHDLPFNRNCNCTLKVKGCLLIIWLHFTWLLLPLSVASISRIESYVFLSFLTFCSHNLKQTFFSRLSLFFLHMPSFGKNQAVSYQWYKYQLQFCLAVGKTLSRVQVQSTTSSESWHCDVK